MNPLPEDEVGPRLLVKLQAEKAIKKLDLKEEWECDDGWHFDDLCAVVASALGPGYVKTGEYARAGRALAAHCHEIGPVLEEVVPDPLDTSAPGAVFVRAEALQTCLILGVGWGTAKKEEKDRMSNSGCLRVAIADCLDVPENVVKTADLTYAKKRCRERYAEHLERMEERRRHGYAPSTSRTLTSKPALKKRGVFTNRERVTMALALAGYNMPGRKFRARSK